MSSGLSGISDQLTKIDQQLQTLKTNAKGEFSPQITAMENSLTELKSSLSAARANPSAGTLTTLASSASSAVNAGNALYSAIVGHCG